MNDIKARFPVIPSSADDFFLFITHGVSQAELAFLSVSGSKEKFIVFTTFDIMEVAVDFSVPDNVRVCSSYRSLLTMLPYCRGVITTIGHFSPVLSAPILEVFRAVSFLDIPIMEVPHGLYQWGFNLSDTSRQVDLASYSVGAGSFVPSFADVQVTWFGDKGIGYPRKSSAVVRPVVEAVVPEYTVITTNTNWYLYGPEAQRVLLSAIFHKALMEPEKMFVWCPHPAELREQSLAFYMKENKPENVFLYGLDREIYFWGLDTTEDVIRHAVSGISTVSTCLLDYEINQKPLLLFSSESTEEICNSISGSGKFTGPVDVCEVEPAKIVTNMLKDYDVSLFDAALQELSALSSAANSSVSKAKSLLRL